MTKLTKSQVLKNAASQVGYEESPAGSNKTKYGIWYGMNGVPWCAEFVSWCFKDDLSIIYGKFARTDYKAKLLSSKKGYYKGHAGIKPGDIVFFSFNGPSYQGRYLGIHHVGICTGKHADGRYITIEGNTSTSSNDNGGAVQIRYRSPSTIAAYFRPEYAAESTNIPSKPIVEKPSASNKPANKTGMVNAKNGLRVRNKPNLTGKVLGILSNGTKITILETIKGWHKIKYKNTYGYVSAKYVK